MLQPGKEYIFFLAAEIQFHKMTDAADTMTIFSSYRNQRWITMEYDSLAITNRIVDEMLIYFNIQIVEDIDDLQNKKESGWVYERIVQMNIVKIERDILHGPCFGHRGVPANKNKPSYKIHPHAYPSLRNSVRLPDPYIPAAFLSHPNICVPMAIVLKLEHMKMGGTGRLSNFISLKRISSALNNLRYRELQTPENDFMINKKDFSKFEDINEGFNDSLIQQYPFLQLYQGFAINMYKFLGKESQHKGDTARITTTLLSKHWNKSSFLQIDLLESVNVLTPPVKDHVLTILDYPSLITHRKDNRYGYACRACQRLFIHLTKFQIHISQFCNPKPTTPRRPKNFILHRAFIKDKTTRKKKRHTLSFGVRQYFKSFQSLVFGSMDFECTSKPISSGFFKEKTPSTTRLYQKPFAFSLSYTTPYNLALPDTLKDVTMKFFDDRYTTLDEFYLTLLKILRQNVVDVNKFIFNTITQDKGPPNLASVSQKDREAYLKADCCSFCRRRFNTKVVSKKNKQVVYTVRKVKHHNHFITIPNLAKKGFTENNEENNHEVLVLCSSCNVATYQDGFLTRNDLKIGMHNGMKYDFIFLCDMISRVGHTQFSQIDENGRVVQLPLVKGDPDILCKDKNTILSLSLRFNCSRMATCPFHSSTGQTSRVKKKPWRSCPYEKRISFFDSALMITASLDNMLQDVRSIHQGKKDLRLVFPRTHHFITQQLGYQEEVFSSLLCKKIPQPFEKIDSLKYALDMKTIPPISHFFSHLRGDGLTGNPSVSRQDYQNFTEIWGKIQAKSYFDVLALYAGADATILSDCLNFYYGYIFSISGLSPLEFVTCASLSWQAALFNSKSPYNENKPLKIHVPGRRVAEIYTAGLKGGYAFVNANYCEFRHLEVNQTNSVPTNMIKQVSFEDINGLYASLLKQKISIGNYVIYSKHENKQQFDKLSQHLLSMDVEFFSKQLHEKNHLFFFVVIMSYDNDALLAPQNVDLSFFPFYDKITLDMLSDHQRTRAERLKRDPGKESYQLVSYLKKNLKVSDYMDNIMYMMGFHNGVIKKVLKIVRSTAFPVFRNWLSRLETEKKRNVSPILNKLYKQMGNNICGKTHQRLDHRVKCKLCLSKTSFEQYTNSEGFYEFTYLNENACLVTFDHLTIVSKNLPAISSRTYSSAKTFMWRLYHSLAARFYYFGRYGIRILMSDTDSYAVALFTEKCNYMLDEMERAKQAGLSSLPLSSYTSRFIANAYLKTMAPFLDFSCINNNSHIFQTFMAHNPSLQETCSTLAKCRRSQSFFIKSEINNKQMEMFLAASVKMYMLVDKDFSPAVIKAKGLKRGLIRQVISTSDFIDVAKHEKPSKVVQQYNLKRLHGTIFLHSVKRRALTLFTSKRIMDPAHFSPGSHFGYPLHFKPFL